MLGTDIISRAIPLPLVLAILLGFVPLAHLDSIGESIPHQLCFKGLFILGGKTYIYHKPSGREPSRRSREQEPGASTGTKSRNQERGPDPDMLLFLKEKYTTPQWAGISAAIG